MKNSPDSLRPRPRQNETLNLNFKEAYETTCDRMDAVIKSHFPTEYMGFEKPLLERTFSREALPSTKRATLILRNYHQNPLSALATRNEDDAMRAAAIVRYVDDFIDTALWPHIHEHDPKELRENFSMFLKDALDAARTFAPRLPDNIILLPQMEMSLELEPTQENFDKTIIPLIEKKSFDLLAQHAMATGDESPLDKDEEAYFRGFSLVDLARDFDEDNYTTEKDFNLYNYLNKYKLDPRVLLDYTVQAINDIGDAQNRRKMGMRSDQAKQVEEIRNECLKFYTKVLSLHTGHKVVIKSINA